MQWDALDNYFPHQQRSRSKSDTSSRPPSGSATDPPFSSFNLNNIVTSASQQPQTHNSFPTDLYRSSGSPNPPSQPNLLGQCTVADSQFLGSNKTLPASLQRARSDSGRVSEHQVSGSESGISYPPSAHSDFIARAAADTLDNAKQQFLHPTETVPNMFRGHHRRSSSGSRDHGIGGMGLHSAPSSSRQSPYPSPSASPLLGYDPLPPTPVPTAEDSERRRKADANFLCPVPGCGSTFTRHFNLKGMLSCP